mmetsp:Transcript_11387/g.16937  ORF Transcript_11387/g.16937 Transcript_11387/m.16937 type:complete len:430 (+) Transcript_11387:96-1385(+)
MNENGENEPIEASTFDSSFELLKRTFASYFGSEPTFYVQAPGRVNLIGEHIDYSDFSVLPCATKQTIKIAVRCEKAVGRDETLKASAFNLDPKFKPAEFPIDPSFSLEPKENGQKWVNYVHSGFKGAFEYIQRNKMTARNGERFDGLFPVVKMCVESDLPAAAGLSSSSALVVAASLAAARSIDISLSKKQLAEVATKSERFVGTMGGGMDQTASVFGIEGKVLLIGFKPKLSFGYLSLPPNCSFVVCDSLVESKKASIAQKHYNKRVLECRLAALFIGKYVGLKNWKSVGTLGQLETIGPIECDLFELERIASECFKEDFYTKSEMEALLAVDLIQFFQSDTKLLQILEESDTFWLQKRAKHTFSEARRVRSFCELCQSFDSGNESEEKNIFIELGALMDQSHESCRNDFDCSCPELNNLVKEAKIKK